MNGWTKLWMAALAAAGAALALGAVASASAPSLRVHGGALHVHVADHGIIFHRNLSIDARRNGAGAVVGRLVDTIVVDFGGGPGNEVNGDPWISRVVALEYAPITACTLFSGGQEVVVDAAIVTTEVVRAPQSGENVGSVSMHGFVDRAEGDFYLHDGAGFAGSGCEDAEWTAEPIVGGNLIIEVG